MPISLKDTANITTANWGTARNIQIGNTTKSVNGSGNVSWSLSEIGAAASSHTHNYMPHTKYTTTQDANNIKTTGVYSFNIPCTNAATTNHGTLIVEFNVGTPYQLWIPDSGNIIYKRTYTTSSGTWGSWNNTLTNNISGNASTATKLQTVRSINGTNFDGTGNITTANWGTARTLTIGNTGKSVNGSGNVSWSLSEIGAAPTSHNHTSLTGVTNIAFAAGASDSASMGIAVSDDKTYFDFNLSDDVNADMWRWRFGAWDTSTSSTKTFNAMTLTATSPTAAKLTVPGTVQASTFSGALSGNATTATTLQTARTINGTSFNGSANITTANWGTARNIQIGNAVKSVNGSGNVTWNWSEMQVPRAYSSSYGFGGNQNAITTAQFITMLTNLGAFSQPYWIARGSWSYASNQYINDTGCGNIHLAGCTVEVMGTSSAYTIRITTPTTSSSGVTNGDFIYVNNGSGYSPGWRRLYNTAYKPTASEIGAAPASHTHAYAPTATGSSISIHADSDSSSTSEYLLLKAGHNELKIASSAGGTTVTKGQDKLTFNGNVVYHTGKKPTPADIGAAAASHTHSYLPLSGGTMTGTLELKLGGSTLTGTGINTGNKQLIGTSADTIYFGNPKTKMVLESISTPTVAVNGKNYAMYHTGNKPTPSDIGAAASSSVGTLSSLKTSAKGNLVDAINEVFQSADSARSSLVSAIGSPLTSTDTLASIATKLQSKKQELGTAAAKVVNGVSSSTNLNTIVSTLNGYKPYVGKAHTLHVDFNGGKTVYIEPQKTNGSTTMKQGSTWMVMIKDVGAKRDYCLCTSSSYGFPSSTKDANNSVSFSIDSSGEVSISCRAYTSKTYKIMLCSITPTYSEIDETESSSYYYVVKTLEEKDEEEGRKDEESNC